MTVSIPVLDSLFKFFSTSLFLRLRRYPKPILHLIRGWREVELQMTWGGVVTRVVFLTFTKTLLLVGLKGLILLYEIPRCLRVSEDSFKIDCLPWSDTWLCGAPYGWDHLWEKALILGLDVAVLASMVLVSASSVGYLGDGSLGLKEMELSAQLIEQRFFCKNSKPYSVWYGEDDRT